MHAILKDREDTKGFFFPFEGERHLATFVLVPYREDTWRLHAAPAIEEFLSVVKTIAAYEMVVVIIDPRIDESIVARFEMKNTHILRLPYDDSWARDSLPIFLRNEKEILGVDFGFNSWGGDYNGLYHPWENDDRLGREALLELMIHRHPAKDFILEGGSVHSDGEGTLLTTECCLLSKGRNPSLTKDQIEERLKKELQVKKVLWLPEGIDEDETDGHVDNIACFLKPGVVALAESENPADPQYEMSKKDREYLENQTDANGRKLEIVSFPLPKIPLQLTKEEADGIVSDEDAIQRKSGRRLAASYINFYQGERFVLVPQFGVEEDQEAVALLRSIYPDKDILPIRSREILLGGGNIHCITKQIPYRYGYEIEPKEEESAATKEKTE